jgi:hypothetical protein
MAHFIVKNLKHPEGHQIPKKSKVVIVGAGMAGLYTAWRLIKEKVYKADQIVILEKLNRTGGRLDSDLINLNGVEVKEEEGGMRFTFDGMDNLMALFMTLPTANENGASNSDEEPIANEIVPFPMKSGGNNRLYFRGVPFKQAEANTIWPQLYNLTEQEVDLSPSDIINIVYNQILAANPHFTAKYPTDEDRIGPDYWENFRLKCQWEEVTMKDWSLWNLFSNIGYSNEAIKMVYQSSGFNGTFLSQMNGGVAYQLLKEFPADPQFRTLSKGFSTLPNALAAQIGKESIFLNTTVSRLDRSGDGYDLEYKITDEKGDEKKNGKIHGAKVILALPRLALEHLFVRSNAFNILNKSESDKLWDTLQTATNQPLLKINIYYPKAWWGNETLVEKGAIAFGPNFSDLPVGSIYPFYAVDDKLAAALEYQQYMIEHQQPIPKEIQKKVDKINNSKYQKPAALTIYCDYMNINYWLALQKNGELFTSPMQDEESNKENQVVFAASQKVVEKATEYFKKVFNVTHIPQPILTSARIWAGSTTIKKEASERFGFGVHQWALHAQDDEIQEKLIEPLPNLFTCNEAYSDYQGWVEGSLRSANLLLKKEWGLDSYSNVYKDKIGQTAEEAITSLYKNNSFEQIKKYIDCDFKEFEEISKAKARENVKQSLKADGVTHDITLTNYDLE